MRKIRIDLFHSHCSFSPGGILWCSSSIAELLIELFPSKSGGQLPSAVFSLKIASEKAGDECSAMGFLDLNSSLKVDTWMRIHVLPPGFLKTSPTATSHLRVDQGCPLLLHTWQSLELDFEAETRHFSFSSLFFFFFLPTFFC